MAKKGIASTRIVHVEFSSVSFQIAIMSYYVKQDIHKNICRVLAAIIFFVLSFYKIIVFLYSYSLPKYGSIEYWLPFLFFWALTSLLPYLLTLKFTKNSWVKTMSKKMENMKNYSLEKKKLLLKLNLVFALLIGFSFGFGYHAGVAIYDMNNPLPIMSVHDINDTHDPYYSRENQAVLANRDSYGGLGRILPIIILGGLYFYIRKRKLSELAFNPQPENTETSKSIIPDAKNDGSDSPASTKYALGNMYLNGGEFLGTNFTQDYSQAFILYQQAANQGYAPAQTSLGLLYLNGKGVPQNNINAVYWLRKSAEQENADAQCELGLMYANGQGVTKDCKEAFTWFKKAADKGNVIAQCWLGIIYLAGKGIFDYSVNKDVIQAVYWFQKAADQGHVMAQINLGSLYKDGNENLSKDYKQAAYWYKKAADLGNQAAIDALVEMGIQSSKT